MPVPKLDLTVAGVLDEKDSLLLKGLSIVSIVLHNILKRMVPVPENEFNFDPARVWNFLEAVREPSTALQATIAYAGHYTVQVFIFLSAYGLALKADGGLGRGYLAFLKHRAARLYPTFLVAIVAWLLIVYLFGGLAAMEERWGSLLLTVLGVENLIPGLELPPVGPWWFFPFIVQVYVVWPLIRGVGLRFGNGGLALLALGGVLVTAALNPMLDGWKLNLLETPVGHLPELCLGVGMARSKRLPSPLLGLVALAVFAAANVWEPIWLLSFPSVLLVSISGYWRLKTVLARSSGSQVLARARGLLVFLGQISAGVFFVNGFVRIFFLAPADELSATTMSLRALGCLVCSAALGALLSPLRNLGGSPLGQGSVQRGD